jgi:hypothetical protein
MEKRKVLRSKKNAAGRGYRMWRITQGVLSRETGMIRVHLYMKGILVAHGFALCRDVPEAQAVANYWLNEGGILEGQRV